MDTILSKDSIFLNRWSRAEYLNGRLVVALISVSLIAIVLVVALIVLALRPRPIYVVSPSLETGIAVPADISEATINAFVVSWLLNWSNYTPATVDEVYQRARRFMSPAFLGKIDVHLAKDLAQVKRDNISALCSIVDEPVLEKNGGMFTVRLTGLSGIYLGKEEIKTQKIRYRINVRKVNPTDANPLGLMIESIDQEMLS